MHFPAHVYRSPSVQWTVCMKANVLIYKWVTLGKPWRCGAFSFWDLSRELAQAHPHWGLRCRGTSWGRLWRVKAKAKCKMIWLVSCETFRISPSGCAHWLKCLSTSLELDTHRPWRTVDQKRPSEGLSAEAHCVWWEKALSSVEEFVSSHTKQALTSVHLNSWGEAAPNPAAVPKPQAEATAS